MLATNFEENLIPEINQILNFALGNKYSNFYLEKYGNNISFPISSYKDFQKVPFLTKDDILATEIENRTFVSQEEIFRYSFSSGTTKNAIPTIIPHTFHGEMTAEKQNNVNDFNEIGVSKMLLLLPPTHGMVRNVLNIQNPTIKYILGDIRNLTFMATIISTLKIEGITSTPTLLDLLIDQMTEQCFDFKTIKWISIGAEFCSTVRYNYFKKMFPSAILQMRYGGSEFGFGKRYYRCQHLEESGFPSVFHIDQSMEIVEIVDEKGQTLQMGELGEIIATDVRQKAFPLLRYKVKDMGSLLQKNCPCGNDFQLTIDGRAGFDVFKIHGMIIRAELIDQAINSVNDIIEPRYQMHIFEENINEKPKLKFQLYAILKKSSANKKEDVFLLEFLKEKISSHLQLSARMTLKQFADEGIIPPLEIKFVEHIEKEGAKSKNIISHIV